ncbi:MAG: ankyrin repeat domain-containing protein [Blastocatellales bacterium]
MKARNLVLLFLVSLFPIIVFTQNANDDLIAAAKKGDAEAVKSLIAKGANVNARTNYGATALHFAADRGHLEVIKVLVEAGADVNAKDDFYKMPPLSMAMMRRHKDVIAYLQQAASAKKDAAQLPQPAQPATALAPAKTADPALNNELLSAAKKGDAAAVKSLLAKGADVNAKTRYNQTPLMFAAQHGHIEIVKTLLDAGADLNVTDTFYKSVTALSAAADKGHAEIVKLLLEKGAKSKETALFIGAQSGHAAVVKVALDMGGLSQENLDRALGFVDEAESKEIVGMLRKVGAKSPEKKQLKPEVKVDEATLKKYAGTYRLDEGRQYTFIARDGKLGGWDVRQYSYSFTAVDKNVFRFGGDDSRTITFNEENGRIVSITLTQTGFKQTYNRVEGK